MTQLEYDSRRGLPSRDDVVKQLYELRGKKSSAEVRLQVRYTEEYIKKQLLKPRYSTQSMDEVIGTLRETAMGLTVEDKRKVLQRNVGNLVDLIFDKNVEFVNITTIED